MRILARRSQGWKPKYSQESYGSSGKSAQENIDIDTHYNVIKDVYVPAKFRRPHMDINTVSMEQHGMTTSSQMLILR